MHLRIVWHAAVIWASFSVSLSGSPTLWQYSVHDDDGEGVDDSVIVDVSDAIFLFLEASSSSSLLFLIDEVDTEDTSAARGAELALDDIVLKDPSQ